MAKGENQGMAYKYVIYEKDGNIARLVFNKPEKLNSLGIIGMEEDWSEVMDAFRQAEQDDDVKVIVLKGAGRAFCTGEDLTRVGVVYGMKPGERRASERVRLKMDREAFESIEHIFLSPKLTIAQIHGYAIEGGLFISMCCDFAIAAKDARLGFPAQRLGFAGGGSPTFPFLVYHVGMKRAVDIIVTGKVIDAVEAEKIGLITKAVPPAKLEQEVNNYAEALTLYPRDGIAMGKATRHDFYNQLGLGNAFTTGYVHHTLFTNIRWEPDEWNFFKERKNKGAKNAFHDRDARFNKLGF